jgi:2-polyprenyl-3-methyl-5-hydroxy-6-metoxy-1,4-benzoquinol methylase
MTAKFWDKRAERYDDLIQKHDAVYLRTIAGAKSLLSTSDVVLDLGCASGEYSLDIAPFVQRVHGIDTSANMIALATEKASDRSIGNVTFDAADVFDRALDAHRYTAVLAFSVLHLVEEIRPVLDRINALLPKGGLFISQTPCLSESSFLFKLFIGVARKVKVVPPILRFTALELEAVIAGAGFDIAESEVWDRKKAVHWIVARKR